MGSLGEQNVRSGANISKFEAYQKEIRFAKFEERFKSFYCNDEKDIPETVTRVGVDSKVPTPWRLTTHW